MTNITADNRDQYIFSPISGERLTMGYCLKLIDKAIDGTITVAEKRDMELAVAWHNALAFARES